jgi:hypothetical protein
MTPEPPPTARTLLESRPRKAPAQVKNLLDAGFNEQYQESVGFVGSSPHGFGAKGALTLFAPFLSPPTKKPLTEAQNNPTPSPTWSTDSDNPPSVKGRRI